MKRKTNLWSRVLCCAMALLLVLSNFPLTASAAQAKHNYVRAIPYDLGELLSRMPTRESTDS